jgi:hypothetical protein
MALTQVATGLLAGSITSDKITSVANTAISGRIATSQQPTGAVLQVVSTTLTTAFSTTSGSMVDVTGLSLSITPRSASSNVLVTVNLSMTPGAAGAVLFYQMVRNSTAIGIGTTGGSNFNVTGVMYTGDASLNQNMIYPSSQLLDSPATTSATTYKVQILSNTPGTTIYINKRSDTYVSAISTITAMEIAG